MTPFRQHYHGVDPETLALLETTLNETWKALRSNALPIPDVDGGAASAGAMPIQTTPTITALLNNTVRIALTLLALAHYLVAE